MEDSDGYVSSGREECETDEEEETIEQGVIQRLRARGNQSWRDLFSGRRETPEPLVQDDSNFKRLMYWTCIEYSGFPNRVNHAVATHRDDNGDYYTYSFGGYHADDDERTVIQADSHGGPYFKSSPIDVHVCDVATRSWTCLQPPPKEKYFNVEPLQRTGVPGCRYGHTVCSYRGRVYMYGGRNDEDGSFTDVDCYDIKRNIWVKLHCTGDKPFSRDGHACTSVGPHMLMHGGFSSKDLKFSGDTYSFNMETHEWQHLPRKGCYVPERDFHTATAIEGSRLMVVFGGRSDEFAPYFTNNDKYDDQFYTYGLDSHVWKRRKVTGYHPNGRRSHCAVSIGCNVLFFGGYNAFYKQHFGDVFALNTDTWHVTEIRPFGSNPCPRRRVGCALVGSEILICGGTSPMKVERKGEMKEILHDHNDVYILHLVPTLQQLSLMAIIEHKISSSLLPLFVKKEIEEQRDKKLVTITPRPMHISGDQ